MKPFLTSQDVKELYDEEYEEILNNHPTAFVVNSMYKINIYTQYLYSYMMTHLKPEDRVLDFGCDNGELLLAIAARMGFCGEYVGVDFNQQAIDTAMHKLDKYKIKNCKFLCCDINDYIPDEKFDYVLMSDVIEHLSDQEMSGVLEKCRKIIKNNGKIIMHTPNGLNEYCQSDETFKSRLFFWLYHRITKEKYKKNVKQLYYEQVHINVKSYRQWKSFFNKHGYTLQVQYDDNGKRGLLNLERLQQLLSLNANMTLIAEKIK